MAFKPKVAGSIPSRRTTFFNPSSRLNSGVLGFAMGAYHKYRWISPFLSILSRIQDDHPQNHMLGGLIETKPVYSGILHQGLHRRLESGVTVFAPISKFYWLPVSNLL
jgi:hypothetical protein